MVEVETPGGSRYILYCIRRAGLCRVESIVLLFMVAKGGFWLLAVGEIKCSETAKDAKGAKEDWGWRVMQ